MAVTTKPHIIENTTYEKVRNPITGDLIANRARQVIWVQGLAAGSGTKGVEQAKAAADACDTTGELDNPNLDGMVLNSVFSRYVSDGTQALVFADWSRLQFSGAGSIDNNNEAEFDGALISVPWIQLSRDISSSTEVWDGTRPNGNWWNGQKAPSVVTDITDGPQPYMRTVGCASIRAPFARTTNPFGSVIGKENMVNSDAVVGFGGYVFPARTIRFDHVHVRRFKESGGTISYRGYYIFTARPDAWDEQVSKFTSGSWTVATVAQHKSTAFSGAFPA